MADSDKDILITPNTGESASPKIEFTGANNATKTITVNDDGTLSFNSTIAATSGSVADGNGNLVTGDAVYDYIAAQGFTTEVGDITAVTAGTGLSGGGTSGAVTLTNAGVTSIVAGSNISIDSSTGAVTITGTDTNTQLSNEQVQDIVGAMFTSNTETNITATYEDGDGTIDLVATDTNSFRTVTAGGNTLGATETLAFTAGSNVTITESGGAVTIASSNASLSSEEVQDIVGAMVDGGTETNIAVTYDDTNGKLNFVSTDTNTQLTQEQVEDFVAGVIVAGSNITKTYDDAAGTLTLAATDTNTQLTTEQVQDIVGAMFASNTETRISATYEDGDGTIDLVVDDMTANTQLSTEQVQDIVGAMVSSNTETNIAVTYDDTNGKLDFVSTDTNTQLTLLDQDDMSSNSATAAASQQSIKAYVDTEVAGLVDSAPSALNTLNELAAALGDDASFSTTTATSLGNRLRVDVSNQGLTSTQQGNALTNLGITASLAEINILDDGLAASDIPNLAASKITSGTFATARIADDAITSAKIADDAIITALIADDAITSALIADDAITTALIADDQITNALMADDAIDSAQLADASIDEVHLNATNSPTDNYILSYDSSSGGFTWIAAGAGEANQNAFSNVAVSGQTTAAADSATDTLTLVAAGGMTITTSGDSITLNSANTNTQLSTEEVQDIVGAMFSSNTETRISATYEDGDGTIDLVVDDMTANDNTWRPVTAGGNTLASSETLAFTAGTGITISESGGAVTITNSVTDTNTWRGVTAGGNTLGSSETLAFTAGSNVTITESGGAVTIASTDTNTTYSAGTGLDLSSTTFSVDVSDFMASGADNRVLTATGTDAFQGEANLTFNGSTLSVSGTNAAALSITATDGGGSPAQTTFIDMTGYETRGQGIRFFDEDASGEEWFAGLRYAGAFDEYMIGYDASGGASEYVASALLQVNKNGNVTASTFVGDLTGTASNVTVSDSTANTNFPVVFHDESNALLDDTGALRYNPSTGTLLVPNLSVSGTQTVVDTVTMEAANAIVFEGATADAHETTLTIVDPTADRTISLPNAGGTVAVSASSGVALSAAGDITANLSASHIPNIATSKVTSGTFADARIAESNVTQHQAAITALGTLTALTGGTGDLTWDTDTLFVDSSADRVGIGTTSPARPLHVMGDIYAQSGDILLSRGNYYLQDASDGTKRGSFTSDGVWAWENVSVGIGTTSPGETLHVAGGGDQAIKVDSTSDGRASVVVEGYKTSDAVFAQIAAINNADSVAGLLFHRDGANDAAAITLNTQATGSTSVAERLKIASGGAITFNDAYTFPTSDGSANQVLQTDGSGALSFATAATGDVTLTGTQTLTNKSLTSPSLTGTVDAAATVNVSGNNKLGISDGGAGAPTLRFIDDTDTGIYRPASGQLGFTSNGTAQVVFGDGWIKPMTDDDIDLGDANKQFKNAFFDGTVEMDNLTIGGSQGSDGEVLTSTGSGVAWEAVSGGASDLDGLSDAKSGGTDFTGSLLIGHQSHGTLDAAVYNTGVGISALDALTSGDNNTALGWSAGSAVTTAADGVYIGKQAGVDITTNGRVTSIGSSAGKNAGFGTTSVGFWAGIWTQATSGVNIGYGAGARGTANATKNVFIGDMPTYGGDGTFEGDYNVAIGDSAMYAINGSANYNIGIGRQTLYTLDDGSDYNTAIGYQAGYAITTGDKNILVGTQSGDNLTTGDRNVIIGGIDASAVDADDTLIIASGDGSVKWIEGDENGDITFTGEHILIFGEESDDYITSTASAGNTNGYQFSYGNGAQNTLKSSSGDDFGMILPVACTLTRLDFHFGNKGSETSNEQQTITVYKNNASTTTTVSFTSGDGSGGNAFKKAFSSLSGNGLSYAAGDAFNLRTTGLSGWTDTQIGPSRMTATFRTT